jgi:hypothetical protein
MAPPQAAADFWKLTMPEMKSIAFVKFGGQILKGDKSAHVAAMKKLVMAQPTILDLSPPAALIAPAQPALAAPPAASESGSESESDESGSDESNDLDELERAQISALAATGAEVP